MNTVTEITLKSVQSFINSFFFIDKPYYFHPKRSNKKRSYSFSHRPYFGNIDAVEAFKVTINSSSQK